MFYSGANNGVPEPYWQERTWELLAPRLLEAACLRDAAGVEYVVAVRAPIIPDLTSA